MAISEFGPSRHDIARALHIAGQEADRNRDFAARLVAEYLLTGGNPATFLDEFKRFKAAAESVWARARQLVGVMKND